MSLKVPPPPPKESCAAGDGLTLTERPWEHLPRVQIRARAQFGSHFRPPRTGLVGAIAGVEVVVRAAAAGRRRRGRIVIVVVIASATAALHRSSATSTGTAGLLGGSALGSGLLLGRRLALGRHGKLVVVVVFVARHRFVLCCLIIVLSVGMFESSKNERHSQGDIFSGDSQGDIFSRDSQGDIFSRDSLGRKSLYTKLAVSLNLAGLTPALTLTTTASVMLRMKVMVAVAKSARIICSCC